MHVQNNLGITITTTTILWKTIALPSIYYACSIWYGNSKKDIEDLEKVQLQMARFLLKAPRYTPREALYGDLGWVPLSQLHELARVKMFNRFIIMDNRRWPNIVLHAMLQLNCDFDKLKYKFLSNCIDIFAKCTDIDLFNHVFDTVNLTFKSSFSVSTVKRYVSESYKSEWSNQISQKISLNEYSKLKLAPKLEKYLLEKTNFYGASLKFKLRSNTLPLDCKTYKWSNDISGFCTLCGNGDIEDVSHFLLNCKALENIRKDELLILKNDLALCDDYDTWTLFISSNTDVKLQLILGGDSVAICDESISIFYNFCKRYTIAAWEKRSDIKKTPINNK